MSSLRAQAELELRRRVRIASPEMRVEVDYRTEHQRKYWDDPVGWVRDCVNWKDGEGPSDYQNDSMAHIPTERRVSVRGPHGIGKSAMAALIVLWFADTRDGLDWKVPTTASAWRQLTKYLWPEIHKWSRRLKWEVLGRKPYVIGKELLTLSLKLNTGEAFAVASDQSELIEGAHADHMLYLFDESKAIPVPTWDSAEGAFSTGDCYFFSISTPGEPSGRFYDIQSRKAGYEDWWSRHVTLEEAIQAGRIKREWAENRKRQWGETSAVYQNRVEGNFAASDEDGVIPLIYVERAIERWHARNDAGDWGKLTRVSADIGRGEDPTVLALLYGTAIKEFEESNLRTTMPVVGRIKGFLDANPQAEAVIDVIGIGSGVVDRLREFKNLIGRVLAFNSSHKTEAKDRTNEFGFVNDRAWAWWTVRELLEDDLIDLPPNDTMIGDLTAPKYRMMSGARIQVEGKGDYVEDGNVVKGLRSRLGRSTNYGDVVIQAYWKKSSGPSMEAIDAYGTGVVDEDDIDPDIKAYMES